MNHSFTTPIPESELEQLLEEKSETIRKLHTENLEYQKVITELEDRLYGPGGTDLANENPQQKTGGNEISASIGELESKKEALAKEIVLMEKQLCDEEIRASRERAEMARQKYDLERLKADLEIEIEKHAKDTSLKTKIDSIKSRLHNAGTEPLRGLKPEPGATPAIPPPAHPKSIFGKLFGGK
jgi:chromosome segregation ATPase